MTACDCASHPLTVKRLFPQAGARTGSGTPTPFEGKNASAKYGLNWKPSVHREHCRRRKPTCCERLCVGTVEWRASTVHSSDHSWPQRERSALNRKDLFMDPALTVQPSTPPSPDFIQELRALSPALLCRLSRVQFEAETLKSVMVETVSIHSQGSL